MSYKVFAVIISAAMLCTMLAGCKDKAGDMNKNSISSQFYFSLAFPP